MARELGRERARRELGMVYGGARIGLMGALADEVLAAGGHVIGVIPEALAAREVAHDGLSELHIVTSMHERKALMADRADGFIALPGGWGTVEEWFEILTWRQLGIHRKPCGLLNVEGYFDRLLSFVEHAFEQGFVRPDCRAMISVSTSPGALLDWLAAYEPTAIRRWIDP